MANYINNEDFLNAMIVYKEDIKKAEEKNKEKWGIYSVHDTNATHISIFDKENNSINKFYIGQSKSNYANNYIRTENDDNVYLTSENISYYLRPVASYWGEKPPQLAPMDSTVTE